MSECKQSVGPRAELTFLEQLMVQALKRATSERDAMRAERQGLRQALDDMTDAANQYRAHAAGLGRKIEHMRADLQQARTEAANAGDAWRAADTKVNEQRAELRAARAEQQTARAVVASAHKARDVAQAKIGDLCKETREQRAEIARLNGLVETLRAENAKHLRQLLAATGATDAGEGLDLTAEARWAMEAVHRVRRCIAERRDSYGLPMELEYNKAYNSGARAALDHVAAALEGGR